MLLQVLTIGWYWCRRLRTHWYAAVVVVVLDDAIIVTAVLLLFLLLLLVMWSICRHCLSDSSLNFSLTTNKLRIRFQIFKVPQMQLVYLVHLCNKIPSKLQTMLWRLVWAT